MGNGLSGARQVLKELTRAVAVLSLLLFALGLTQPGTAAPPTAAVASLVASIISVAPLCGGGDAHGDVSHGACHACRFGVVALPAPPCTAERAFVAPVAVSYAAFPVQPAFARQRATALSRAPPFA